MIIEIYAQLLEVFLYGMPSLFKKHIARSIRPWGFVRGQVQNNIINFLVAKRQTKMIQIATAGYNIVKFEL
jgi:hypothetical protein